MCGPVVIMCPEPRAPGSTPVERAREKKPQGSSSRGPQPALGEANWQGLVSRRGQWARVQVPAAVSTPLPSSDLSTPVTGRKSHLLTVCLPQQRASALTRSMFISVLSVGAVGAWCIGGCYKLGLN